VTTVPFYNLVPDIAVILERRLTESRGAKLAIHIGWALAFRLLIAATAAGAQVAARGGDPAPPNGLVVVIEDKPQQPRLNLNALQKPFISGVALQIHWADLEPTEGKPDWAKLDQLFAAADSSKKWVQLLIFPGFFSPKWALDGVQTEQFPIEYGPGHGTMLPLPMPWDKVYLSRWFAFMKLVSDRYGNSPSFRVVAAAGPTSVSVEASLPFTPADMEKWQSVSYRPSKYIEAWQTVFQAYAATFPKQFISLSQGTGLHINDDGKNDPRERVRTIQQIVDEGVRIVGHRFVLQSSNVHAGPGPHEANSEKSDQFVIGYIGRTITGFQLRTSALMASGVMGAEGDPALALKRSLDDALAVNSAGQHVNYVEVYEPDVLAENLQSVLRDAASSFAK
jgi:hypothetical protein